jgi:hypothetical protein
MPALALGLGIPFTRRMGAGIDAQAQAHYNRVIADGGLIPSGLVGVNNFFKTVKGIYGTSDITTAISVGLDAQVLGYKLGAGAGTTAGQAAQKLYSCSGASGDVVQTTAASQPLLLVHSGANYWWGSGASGNFLTTPNAAANQITGDIDIIANIQYVNNSGSQFIVSKTQTAVSNHGYDFFINSSNNLYYQQTRGGVFNGISSSVGIGASYTGWVRMTRVSSTGVVTFFTGTDGINWTQLGTTFTLFSGALDNPTASVYIGSYFNGNNVYQNRLFRVTISNSIGGAPVVDFNPNQYNASTSQTQWTSSTGEVWSLNVGTATTGYKGALVSKTIVQSDGVDDTMQSGTITSRTNFTRYFAFNTLVASGTQYFIDGDVSNRHLIYKGSSQVRLYNDGTGAGEILNANTVGLKLITGDYNTATSKLRTNAGSDTNGSTGNASSTKVTLFGAGSGGTNSNIIVTTSIDAIAVSNDTQKTAMYNYIRSINGNSF